MKETAAGKFRPGGGAPKVSVAKEFVRGDRVSHPGARSKEQIADRKRDMDMWAKGK